MNKATRIVLSLVALLVLGAGIFIFTAMSGEVQAGGTHTCSSAVGIECVCTDGCSAGFVDCTCS